MRLWQNVADAVTLGATRIGHGIALKDTRIFGALKRKKVLLEMCPTSNFKQEPSKHWLNTLFNNL